MQDFRKWFEKKFISSKEIGERLGYKSKNKKSEIIKKLNEKANNLGLIEPKSGHAYRFLFDEMVGDNSEMV